MMAGAMVAAPPSKKSKKAKGEKAKKKAKKAENTHVWHPSVAVAVLAATGGVGQGGSKALGGGVEVDT